jgi:hypothetical protein
MYIAINIDLCDLLFAIHPTPKLSFLKVLVDFGSDKLLALVSSYPETASGWETEGCKLEAASGGEHHCIK